MPPQTQALHSSARYYTPSILKIYDFGVLWLSNYVWWRCPTTSVLLPFFKEHIGGEAHLDVGIGTGYYPSHSVEKLSKTRKVVLADINPATLQMATARLRTAGYQGDLQTLQHDVFKSLPESMNGHFDSISLFYLFHCLPGAFPRKADIVLSHLKAALSPRGTLYGATILGQGVSHNLPGRYFMDFYNRKGVFGNTEDSADGLMEALRKHFEDVDIKMVGPVALFLAKKPLHNIRVSRMAVDTRPLHLG